MSEINKVKALQVEPVPFLPLEEVAEIHNGKTDRHLAAGNVPVYGSGGIMRYANKAANGGPAVLVPRKGSLANITYVNGPFWTVDTIFYTLTRDFIKPKFLYYYLLTQHVEDLNQAGGVPSLTQATLKRIRIPVPSLKVQEEIVRILDSFTSLETELETELEARRKQYEYYRDGLLTFKKLDHGKINTLIEELCPDCVRYVNLGDFTEYSSARISVSELDKTSFVGVDNLLPNKAGRTDAKHLPSSQRLTEFATNDLLIGNIRPYLKKIWLADRRGGCSGDVLAVHIKEHCIKLLHPQFLYYLLSSDRFFWFDQQHAKGGKMPRGSKQQVMRYRIPIPPLKAQEEIVRILDSFTSLETELETELEARRKQYEYYRDRLLTFKELDHE